MRSRFDRFIGCCLIRAVTSLPTLATAAGNPLFRARTVFFNPGNGEDIVVPSGFRFVFAQGLNFPTAVAFRGRRTPVLTCFVLGRGTVCRVGARRVE